MKQLILFFSLVLFSTNVKAQTFQLVKDIDPVAGSDPGSFIEFNGELIFGAHDSTHKTELWKSDGTTNGTQLLKDINPVSSSSPYNFFEFNNKVYFSAVDTANGYELFVTDGTSAGTSLLKNINTNTINQISSSINYFFNLNGNLLFRAEDGTHGHELWVTDGTNAGTQILKDIYLGSNSGMPNQFFKFGNQLYFSAMDSAQGRELWVTDGTAAGTQLFLDINLATSPNSHSSPRFFKEFNGKFYFNADDGIHGQELWVSDGTVAGTQMLKDINQNTSGYLGSDPINLNVYNGKLYFYANDSTHGKELWVTDGTSVGTQLFLDINPGPAGSHGLVYPTSFIEYNGKLYFGADNGTVGSELWVTDGTQTGTQLFKDLNPIVSAWGISGRPKWMKIYNGKLYFVANMGGSDITIEQELWETDGTALGTNMIGPIVQISPGYVRQGFTEYNGSLYFSADYLNIGNELWKFTTVPIAVKDVTKDHSVNIYPNPATNALHISVSDDLKINKVVIYDLAGKIVNSPSIVNGTIEVSTLSAGPYILQIETTEGAIKKEFVKY